MFCVIGSHFVINVFCFFSSKHVFVIKSTISDLFVKFACFNLLSKLLKSKGSNIYRYHDYEFFL